MYCMADAGAGVHAVSAIMSEMMDRNILAGYTNHTNTTTCCTCSTTNSTIIVATVCALST